MTVHGLRHSVASVMIESNVPVPHVAKTLGHASVATTLSIYAHVIDGEAALAAAVQALRPTTASATMRRRAARPKP